MQSKVCGGHGGRFDLRNRSVAPAGFPVPAYARPNLVLPVTGILADAENLLSEITFPIA